MEFSQFGVSCSPLLACIDKALLTWGGKQDLEERIFGVPPQQDFLRTEKTDGHMEPKIRTGIMGGSHRGRD